MTLSLREKRRQETARDIQKSTLELAVSHDLDNVTTEEIAAAAGISTRTFFNYYANKEAAAIGHPPSFRDDEIEALRTGSGDLAADLKLFLDRHIATLAGDEDILRMVGKVLQSNEKARGILDGFLMTERHVLTECLSERVGNRQTAAALASYATDAIGRAIFLWEHAKSMSLNEALDVVWGGVIDASRVLIKPNR
ncbi:TetR/AcrR family transcriptional regulator [uncultured Pelagimonas sp.]|uniref:TetR/AcrR family transcriptional regulator n=1 Tax=uncultured Pelagimonas sp. TaxID=1618102 RepID=UPI00260FB03C|nr:TetR/AcrR family transcriptional regulator [uncultured Pelagimonas sp.]